MAAMGWHFNPANPFGCLQFSDIERNELFSCMTMTVRLLALPGSILGFLVFWLTLPTWITICFGPPVTMGFLVIVMCAWLPLALVMVALLAPCGVNDDMGFLLLCAPISSCWASFECLCGPFDV